jgi:hypothetical protein
MRSLASYFEVLARRRASDHPDCPACVSGPEAVDILLMDAMTRTWILVMVLTPNALVAYGLVGLARWLMSARKP